MRILIIGSAGAVGTVLVKGLCDRHELRGFDIVPTPDMDDSIEGDVSDFDAVLEATRGMDAVIHLAGKPLAGIRWSEKGKMLSRPVELHWLRRYPPK